MAKLKKTDTLGSFLLSIMELEIRAHHWHLVTRNHREHLIFSQLYTDIHELLDILVEAAQGGALLEYLDFYQSDLRLIPPVHAMFQLESLESRLVLLLPKMEQHPFVKHLLEQLGTLLWKYIYLLAME